MKIPAKLITNRISAILLVSLCASFLEVRGGTMIVADTWLGVKRGGELRFYGYGAWKGKLPGKELGFPGPNGATKGLVLPPQTNELIFSGNWLGVRSGRELRFFNTSKEFQRDRKWDRILPEGTQELLFSGNLLGIRIGQELKFYDISDGFVHKPKYDFECPVGTTELILAHNLTGSWLGVRSGKELAFYNIDKGYKAREDYVFTLPAGTEEIGVSGMWLLVKIGDSISFYDFSKKFKKLPKLELKLDDEK